MTRRTRLALGITALATLGAIAAPATAQVAAGQQAVLTPTQAKRANIARMLKPVEIEFEQQRLEDVITFIAQFTGAEIEAYWADEVSSGMGLDRDQPITLKARRVSALTLLEMVLEKSATDLAFAGGGNTWQMTDYGAIEIGPKERLMLNQRLETYDISDLLTVIPDYEDAPEIDLQQVLQSGQGGGGQSPFQENDDDREDQLTRQERADEVVDILQLFVEPETWLGGATVQYYQGMLLVRGPDYLHRQINGYPWWPTNRTVMGQLNGRRYVSLGGRFDHAGEVEFEKVPVTGVAGGGGGGGGPGGPG